MAPSKSEIRVSFGLSYMVPSKSELCVSYGPSCMVPSKSELRVPFGLSYAALYYPSSRAPEMSYVALYYPSFGAPELSYVALSSSFPWESECSFNAGLWRIGTDYVTSPSIQASL